MCALSAGKEDDVDDGHPSRKRRVEETKVATEEAGPAPMEGVDDGGPRSPSKQERREREIAQIMAEKAKEEEEGLHSLGFSDDEGDGSFGPRDDEQGKVSATARRHAVLEVPRPNVRGSMSPPPSPVARTPPATPPASPTLQQFRHHVKRMKRQLQEEEEVDMGKPIVPDDGLDVETTPKDQEEAEEGAPPPNTSPTTKQPSLSPSSSFSPRRTVTKSPTKLTPLPGRIVR